MIEWCDFFFLFRCHIITAQQSVFMVSLIVWHDICNLSTIHSAPRPITSHHVNRIDLFLNFRSQEIQNQLKNYFTDLVYSWPHIIWNVAAVKKVYALCTWHKHIMSWMSLFCHLKIYIYIYTQYSPCSVLLQDSDSDLLGPILNGYQNQCSWCLWHWTGGLLKMNWCNVYWKMFST